MAENQTLKNPIAKIKELLLRDGKIEIKISPNNHDDMYDALQSFLDKCDRIEFEYINVITEKEYYYLYIYECPDVGYVYITEHELTNQSIINVVRATSLEDAREMWYLDILYIANHIRAIAKKLAEKHEDNEIVEVLQELANGLENDDE